MPARIQAVTAEDIQRVARTYFTPEDRNIMWYSRKEGTQEDPGLAALQGQAKTAAKQMLARIAQVEDPAQLSQMIAHLEGSMGQAPPEFQPALELVLERARQRLEELESSTAEVK